MSSRKDRLYNYMVNTFDLSKERILQYVDIRVEDVINKNIRSKLDSKSIETMILNAIAGYLKDGFKGNYIWGYKDSFEKLVKEVVDKQVKKILLEKYSIEISKKGR